MSGARRKDSAGSLAAADGDHAPLQVNSTGELRVVTDSTRSSVAANLATATTGGGTPGGFVADGSNYQKVVKASSGTLYHLSAFNDGSANLYLRVYDKATNPVPGSDTPKWRFLVPPGGLSVSLPPQGAAFATGISYVLTTDVADSDTTAVSANGAFVNHLHA